MQNEQEVRSFCNIDKTKKGFDEKLKMNITYIKNARPSRRQLLGVKFNQAIEHF
jgi:hypothetical protein